MMLLIERVKSFPVKLPTACASLRCVSAEDNIHAHDTLKLEQVLTRPIMVFLLAHPQRQADAPLLCGGRRADVGTRNPTAAM